MILCDKHLPVFEQDGFDIHYIGKYRKTLMGLAALGIFIMHFMSIGVLQFSSRLILLEKVFSFSTAIGVDLFCLLSGYGIFYSLSKHPTMIEYAQKRLERVYLPFLVITIPVYLWILKIPIVVCLFKWSTMYYWFVENDGTWFVSFILLMYAIAPYFLALYTKGTKNQMITKHVVFVTFLWGLNVFLVHQFPVIGNRWYLALTRIPIFFTGMLFASMEQRNDRIHWQVIILLSVIFLSKAIFNRDLGVVDALCFNCRCVVLVCIGCEIWNWINSDWQIKLHLINTIGGCSLEFYLIHCMIMKWMKIVPERLQSYQNSTTATIISLVVTFALSVLVNNFCKYILRFLGEISSKMKKINRL